MILAELSMSDGTVLGVFVITAAGAALACNQIMDLMDRFKSKPPIDQQMAEARDHAIAQFASKDDLEHSSQIFDLKMAQLVTAVTNLAAQQEQRDSNLHTRINEMIMNDNKTRIQLARHSQSLRMGSGGRMDKERAILWSLTPLPEFFLQAEDILFVDANNKASEAFTFGEMKAALDLLEKRRLVIGQRVQGQMKWKITGAGRAWLKES